MADVEKVARAIPDAAVEAALGQSPYLHTDAARAWMRAAIEAALAAMGGPASHPDEPRPKHLCQMIRDGLAAGACLAIAEPDEDGFLARSLILPADEVEEMLRLADNTGITQVLADLRRQLHHTQAELMLATSPRPEAVEEALPRDASRFAHLSVGAPAVISSDASRNIAFISTAELLASPRTAATEEIAAIAESLRQAYPMEASRILILLGRAEAAKEKGAG